MPTKWLKLPRLCCLASASSSKEEEEANEQDDEDEAAAVEDNNVKNAVLSKRPSIVFLSHLSNNNGSEDGIGIIIRKDLILTSHGTIPSVQSAKAGEMEMNYPVRRGCCPTQTTLKQKLLPHKFFITNPALDMTVIACDDVSPVVPLTIDLSRGSREPMGCNSKVYILGAPHGSSNKSLRIGEGRVTTDNGSIVKFSTDGQTWLQGSAGFSDQGEFAFMVCEPRRFITRAASIEGRSSPTRRKRSIVQQTSVSLTEILCWMEDHLLADEETPPGGEEDHNDERHEHDNDEIEVSFSPRSVTLDSPSGGLNPRQPGISYPATATPSTNPSPRSSPSRRRICPSPRQPGISYSISPSPRSLRSARSRRSSRRSSPRYRVSSPCEQPAAGLRSSSPGCCSGMRGAGRRESDQEQSDDRTFQELHEELGMLPPCPPLSSSDPSASSSEEEEISPSTISMTFSKSFPRGRSRRPRSVAATKKQIFIKGPIRPVRGRQSGEESGASDAELYLGVGYMKHTQVSKIKTNKKKDGSGFTVWHH